MAKDGVATALSGRKVLPRWRAPAESIDELISSNKREPIKLRSGWIEKLQSDFESDPTPAKGRELVESAFVLGVELSSKILRATDNIESYRPKLAIKLPIILWFRSQKPPALEAFLCL